MAARDRLLQGSSWMRGPGLESQWWQGFGIEVVERPVAFGA